MSHDDFSLNDVQDPLDEASMCDPSPLYQFLRQESKTAAIFSLVFTVRVKVSSTAPLTVDRRIDVRAEKSCPDKSERSWTISSEHQSPCDTVQMILQSANSITSKMISNVQLQDPSFPFASKEEVEKEVRSRLKAHLVHTLKGIVGEEVVDLSAFRSDDCSVVRASEWDIYVSETEIFDEPLTEAQ